MEEEGVIAEFRHLIDVEFQEFSNASQQLGEPIFGLSNMVKRAFRNLLSFIIDGVSMERPSDATFKNMTELLGKEIADIQSFRDRNRQIQEVFNHLSTVSESVVALSWISVNNSPAQFVHDMRDAGQYFGNRVLSQYKGNQQHQEWINKWNQVLSALEAYVKRYHRTGFTWNIVRRRREYGRPTIEGDAGLLSQGSPPPPPPPPPAMDLIEGGDTRQNLLRDLNQGVDIVRSASTPSPPLSPPLPGAFSLGSIVASAARESSSSPEISSDSSSGSVIVSPAIYAPLSPEIILSDSSSGSVIASPPRDAPLPPEISALVADFASQSKIAPMLKPVNKEQPSQSQQSLPSTSGENLSRKHIAERTYPPKFLLDGRKWRVEHQKDRYDLVIDSAEMSHSLAMFKCQNSGLEVRNKLNGVTIDNCKRATVVLKDIISSVELIGCQHVKLQCAGHVPLISIDNCDSVEIYLTDKSLDAEMISSKSSSLNISLMKPNGDYTEMAVPEQIKTVVVDGKLVSTVVEKN